MRSDTSKPLDIALWVVSGLLAAVFLVSGWAKIGGLPNHQLMLRWGYTPGATVMWGILEITGGILLLVKRVAGWAALGLMVIVLSSVWTFVSHQDYPMLITAIVVLALLIFLAWGRGLPWRISAEGATALNAPVANPIEPSEDTEDAESQPSTR